MAFTNGGLIFISRTFLLYQVHPVLLAVETMLQSWYFSSGQFLQFSVIFQTFDDFNITWSKHFFFNKEHQTEYKAFKVSSIDLRSKYCTKQPLQILSPSSVLDDTPNCSLVLYILAYHLKLTNNVSLFLFLFLIMNSSSFCNWIQSPNCFPRLWACFIFEHHVHVPMKVGVVKWDGCIAVQE